MKLSKIAFIFLTTIGVVISVIMAIDAHRNLITQEEIILDLYSSRLSSVFSSSAKTVNSLRAVMENHNGELHHNEFQHLAEAMYQEELGNIILITKGSLITQVYPIQDSTSALGIDVLENTVTKSSAEAVRDSGKMVVLGPVEVLTGRQAFIIAEPVLYQGEPIGFSVISMELQSLIKYVELGELEKLGYSYRFITYYQGKEIIASEQGDYNHQRGSSTEFSVGDGDDTIVLQVQHKNHQYVVAAYGVFWLLLFLAIAVLTAKGVNHMEAHRAELATKLESDPLTGALNRIGMEKSVERQELSDFYLFFIDLDKFKPINDIHGHEVGDKLLIAYVKRLKASLTSDSLVVRLGGDEFAVLTPNIKENEMKIIHERLKKISQNPFAVDGLILEVSASIGYAHSRENEDFSELMNIADKNMYIEKQAGKGKGEGICDGLGLFS